MLPQAISGKDIDKLKIKTGYLTDYWRMHYAGLAMQRAVDRLVNVKDTQEMAKECFMIADAMIKQSKVSHD